MAWCDDCDRYFVNEDALQKHLNYAEVHRPVYYCEPCEQHFSNAHGLEQHKAYSMKHLNRVCRYVCESCKKGYHKLKSLEDHNEESHYWCKQHDRFFQNANDLRQVRNC